MAQNSDDLDVELVIRVKDIGGGFRFEIDEDDEGQGMVRVRYIEDADGKDRVFNDGITMTPDQADKVCIAIQQVVANLRVREEAANLRMREGSG